MQRFSDSTEKAMPVTVDFESDLKGAVLRLLPHDHAYRLELKRKPATELLVLFYNWHQRYIWLRPRRVHLSKQLRSNPLYRDPAYQAALLDMAAGLELGLDLTRYLSKDILVGYKPRPKPRRRRDLDLMLNDWGIHHLHLSTAPAGDGFTKRTGPLLFAAIRPNDAYLIDIAQHGDWACPDIVRTVVENWPESQLFAVMPRILPPGTARTPDEIDLLRRSGIQTTVEIDGKVYFPPYGITSACISRAATTAAARTLRALHEFERLLEDDPDHIARSLLGRGVVMGAEPDLHVEFLSDGGFGVVETGSKALFRLDELRQRFM